LVKIKIISLLALSDCALSYDYRRPLITDADIIELKSSRHPMLEQNIQNYIPNDICLGKLSEEVENPKSILLTGPNSSGKLSPTYNYE
jgi:DNA mismatch repair protein MutS